MSTLHFFKKHLVAKATVEGGAVRGSCGVPVRPVMQNGHIVEMRWTPGSTVCMNCLMKLQVRKDTPAIRQHYKKTLALAPAAGDPQEG